VFINLTRQQLASQTLELTVWDYDRFKTHDFLGEVSLNMSGNRHPLNNLNFPSSVFLLAQVTGRFPVVSDFKIADIY